MYNCTQRRWACTPIVVELDDRGHGVGVDGRQFELHAVIDMGNSEQAAHFISRPADAVEIAHGVESK
jgi:hypothetical protein